MKWYKDLYIGEKAKENINKTIHMIRHGKLQFNKFVLTLPSNNHDVLDIYPASILIQRRYMNSDMTIIGIAEGMDEAKELMQTIIMECYNSTGDFDLKEYICKKTVTD